MKRHLPSEEELKDAFLRWLNEERRANYEATSRPDRVDRNKKEIDYVLEDREKSAKIALEISTIWRSASAGKEDAEFAKWVDAFCATVRGRVAGGFQLDVPMTIPKSCEPRQFGEELVRTLPGLGPRFAASGR